MTPRPEVKTAVDATKPRLPGGACSTSCTIVPLYSPPAENPWSRRMAVKSSGAAIPMTAYTGRNAVSAIGAVIMRMERTSALLRP